jgi:hypothetical protein
MKRTGFAAKGWPFPPKPAKTIGDGYTPRPRAVAISDGKARMSMPVPKRDYLRDKDYRRWVSALPCEGILTPLADTFQLWNRPSVAAPGSQWRTPDLHRLIPTYTVLIYLLLSRLR